tara:strand:+ start:6814 stop:7005 length:192 start_codon:yes stop_codon:yes gene_type:complete
MRCYGCNALLTDEESVKRDPLNPDQFLDLCGMCCTASHAAVADVVVEDFINNMRSNLLEDPDD